MPGSLDLWWVVDPWQPQTTNWPTHLGTPAHYDCFLSPPLSSGSRHHSHQLSLLLVIINSTLFFVFCGYWWSFFHLFLIRIVKQSCPCPFLADGDMNAAIGEEQAIAWWWICTYFYNLETLCDSAEDYAYVDFHLACHWPTAGSWPSPPLPKLPKTLGHHSTRECTIRGQLYPHSGWPPWRGLLSRGMKSWRTGTQAQYCLGPRLRRSTKRLLHYDRMMQVET